MNANSLKYYQGGRQLSSCGNDNRKPCGFRANQSDARRGIGRSFNAVRAKEDSEDCSGSRASQAKGFSLKGYSIRPGKWGMGS